MLKIFTRIDFRADERHLGRDRFNSRLLLIILQFFSSLRHIQFFHQVELFLLQFLTKDIWVGDDSPLRFLVKFSFSLLEYFFLWHEFILTLEIRYGFKNLSPFLPQPSSFSDFVLWDLSEYWPISANSGFLNLQITSCVVWGLPQNVNQQIHLLQIETTPPFELLHHLPHLELLCPLDWLEFAGMSIRT